MVQFWITLQKLVQYNIKIIFGNKFLYFMLSALAFYVITVIVKLLGDDEITQATAYSMLMLPSILLVFYPMCFGIQNDQDAKIVEIIFGIPNYSYKVWLLRLIISYVICFVITCSPDGTDPTSHGPGSFYRHAFLHAKHDDQKRERDFRGDYHYRPVILHDTGSYRG